MATQSTRSGSARAGTGSRATSATAGVLRRAVSESQADQLTDRAAALTYYGILSIFPALIALVSIAGIVRQPATKPLLTNIGAFTPGAARDVLQSAVTGLTHGRSTAGLLFFAGLAGAFWAASGYVAAFMRAANVIWDVEEGRPMWKTLALRLIVTLVTVVLLAAMMFGLLYYPAPNVRHETFRSILPGGLVAVLLWIVASALFGLYVAKFGSYNKTYGSLGAVIIFLV